MSPEDDISEGPSRSQLKREVEALQKLGEQLVELPEQQLAALSLPEKLHDAVAQARRITSYGALKRQRQYIGRLMRDVDAALIRARLEELRGAGRLSRARFQDAERWRDRLLREGDAVLEEFLARHPQTDRPHLRRLLREAARDAAAGRPPRQARALFRYIQSLHMT
ncbi:MAG: ribosome biogenesis factor YjgA [Gammaproteobacteria bacterium]